MKTLKQYIIDEIDMDIYEVIDKDNKKHFAIEYDCLEDIATNIVKYFSLCAVGKCSELLSDTKCDKFNEEVEQVNNYLGSSGNW